MTSGDGADGIGHSEDRESEGEGDTDEANAELWKCGGKNRGTATSEYEPESAKEFCSCTFEERHRDDPP
jgi:hypothetical protein